MKTVALVLAMLPMPGAVVIGDARDGMEAAAFAGLIYVALWYVLLRLAARTTAGREPGARVPGGRSRPV